MLIRIIRAPVPCGSIEEIRLPHFPEGTGVMAYSDLPSRKTLEVFGREIPLLCDGTIRYSGEPVLLLYGKDDRLLDELEQQISIDIDTDYTVLTMDGYSEEQVDSTVHYQRGKPERNFEKSWKIIEEEYRTAALNHYDLDPQGAAAFPGKSGIEISSATQWPFNVRDNAASCLGIPAGKVVINVPAMGKSHSGKLWYAGLLACYAAVVASATETPSICLLSKKDTILYTPGRAASAIRHKTGLSEDGKILCRSIDISIDSGAYPMLSGELLNRICFSAAGVYSTPALEITARSIRTSKPPAGAFNGMGFHQSFFAAETHSNSLAAAAGMGPLEWRILNAARNHSSLPIGWENKKALQLPLMLERVADMSDFQRKNAAYRLSAHMQNYYSGKRRGIGMAVSCQGNGFMGKVEENEKYTVSARLNKDGSLLILTSAVPENFQTADLWMEIAGEILDIETENIRIETTSTSLVPDSGPSLFSRNITVITQLIEKCCDAIKKSRFRLPLPIEVKRSYRLPRTKGWDPESFSGTPFPTVSWGAAAVETETDPISLETSVRGVWMSVDCGKIIDHDMARAELENEIYRSIVNTTMRAVSTPSAQDGSAADTGGTSAKHPDNNRFYKQQGKPARRYWRTARQSHPGCTYRGCGDGACYQSAQHPCYP